jgi:osmoprotectant transport system permease protein
VNWFGSKMEKSFKNKNGMKKYLICILLIFKIILPIIAQTTLKVGTKHSNESYILGEIVAQILEDGGFKIERKFNLGGTAISFEALKKGSIDVYPEYSGTIAAEILKQKSTNLDSLNQKLKTQFQLEISAPFGFNNTYALALSPDLARKYPLKTITDLAAHPEWRAGLSYEFLKREDGWGNLSKAYQLTLKATGLEHGIAYQALMNHEIELTDAYSTDGEIAKYGFTLLEDNLHFFPKYEALALYRSALPEKAKNLLEKLGHTLNDTTMQRLNSLALFEKQTHQKIAQDFLAAQKMIQNKPVESISTMQDILNHIFIHLKLTLLSLIAAILVAVPFGILLHRFPRFSKPLLYLTGILQTIPSIALLALMIPFLGIGVLPAIVALFLYALLPILRNTVIGFSSIDPTLKKIATAIGLNPLQKLWHVELPLAMPMILTGIRTAAVINVGTATLAAFIGAGGLGEFIVTGLALNQTELILRGAIPSALLAIGIELCFEIIDKLLIPKHLRQKI